MRCHPHRYRSRLLKCLRDRNGRDNDIFVGLFFAFYLTDKIDTGNLFVATAFRDLKFLFV